MNTVESNRIRGSLKTRSIDGAKERAQKWLPELNKALIDKILEKDGQEGHHRSANSLSKTS